HIYFFSSRRRHTRFSRDWSSDVCSSDLGRHVPAAVGGPPGRLEGVQSHLLQQLVQADGLAALLWTEQPPPDDTGGDEGHRHRERSEERRVGKECRTGRKPQK